MKYAIKTLTFALLLSLSMTTAAFSADQQPWPQDAQDVAFAIAAKVTGEAGLDNITFAPGTEATIEGSDGFYSAFDAGNIILTGYRNMGTGSSYQAAVSGVLNLRDKNERLVALMFAADYTVSGEAIQITRCAAATGSPATVPLEVYAVPSQVFRESCPKEAAANWDDMYAFVKENAYDPNKGEADTDTYMMVTFVKSRLPQNAEFEAIVGERKSVRRSKNNLAKLDQEYLDYQGWRVHMFAARFKPSSMRGRFYINYYYTPGSGMPKRDRDRDRTLIARYDSKD